MKLPAYQKIAQDECFATMYKLIIYYLLKTSLNRVSDFNFYTLHIDIFLRGENENRGFYFWIPINYFQI
jgi:hypothetical protein